MKKPDQIFAEFENSLEAISDKKQRIRKITDFSIMYADSEPMYILGLLDKGISMANEIGDEAGRLLCLSYKIFSNMTTQGVFGDSIIKTIEELDEKVSALDYDLETKMKAKNLIAYFYWFRGDYERSFNITFENLKFHKSQEGEHFAWTNFSLAVFYFDTKDYENAKIYYTIALEKFTEINFTYGCARASNGLGSIAIIENKAEEAKPLLQYAASVYKNMAHYSGLSRALTDLGMLEKSAGNVSKAFEYIKESLAIRKEINHIQGLITSYSELGEIYLSTHEYALALTQLELGLELAKKVNSRQKQMRLFKLFYEAYKAIANTEGALKNLEAYYDLKAQLLSDETNNNMKKLQTQYQKAAAEKEAELERIKNFELKEANIIIEQKNKDITDSIIYARRIQQSLLPQETYIIKAIQRCKS